MAPAPTSKKNKRPVGAGLSLDKFATLGVSKFDKRQKLERIQKQKLIKYSKYKKLKHKLEAQGVLASVPVRDSIAELEALDADGSGDASDDQDAGRAVNHAERLATHAQAGPNQNVLAATHQRKRPRDTQPTSACARSGAAVPPADTPKQQVLHKSEQQSPGARKRLRHDEGSPAPKAGQRRPADAGAQEAAPSGNNGRDHHGRKDGHGATKLSTVQRLAQKVAEEKVEKQRAKEAAMKEREARMKQVAAAEKGRKEQKHLHFKRNAKGQPLMRYRMEKLLSQLQQPGQ